MPLDKAAKAKIPGKTGFPGMGTGLKDRPWLASGTLPWFQVIPRAMPGRGKLAQLSPRIGPRLAQQAGPNGMEGEREQGHKTRQVSKEGAGQRRSGNVAAPV
jgi:hypothetical protein